MRFVFFTLLVLCCLLPCRDVETLLPTCRLVGAQPSFSICLRGQRVFRANLVSFGSPFCPALAGLLGGFDRTHFLLRYLISAANLYAIRAQVRMVRPAALARPLAVKARALSTPAAAPAAPVVHHEPSFDHEGFSHPRLNKIFELTKNNKVCERSAASC